MKTMLLAAAAVPAIGAGSAFAGDGQSATTLFTPLPGEQAVPALATSPAMAAIGPNGVVTKPMRPPVTRPAPGCSRPTRSVAA
jgi:hypothetical protein